MRNPAQIEVQWWPNIARGWAEARLEKAGFPELVNFQLRVELSQYLEIDADCKTYAARLEELMAEFRYQTGDT